MLPIELRNGYLVCVTCKGYIDAGDESPACECIEVNFSEKERLVN